MEDPGRACSGVENLSRLPDELHSRILSLLCTKDAVRTSVLSTRWRYLYTSIINVGLDFNSEVLKITDEQDCMNFVDRFLFYRKKCALDRFKLKWKMSQALDPLRLENWIKFVIGHGIRELDLCIYDFELKDLLLPSCLFTSKTLEVLKLSICLRSNYFSTESKARGYDLELPAKVCLPSLKSVHLENVSFSEDSWSKLSLSCPILEEFLLSFSWGRGEIKLVVSSPTLKRLTVDLKSGCFDVVVDAPSLVYLGFSIGSIKSIKLVNAQSLVEVNTGIFQGRGDIPSFINFGNELMRGIRNIQKLRIGTSTLAAFKCLAISIPMLHNMIHLTIYACRGRGLAILPYILEKCESLETLVLEDLCVWRYDKWNNVEESRISCLSSAVKTIKVGEFKGEEHEVEMVKYFLETAKVLELIEIHLYSICKNPSEITTKLQMLPKNSEALMNIIRPWLLLLHCCHYGSELSLCRLTRGFR